MRHSEEISTSVSTIGSAVMTLGIIKWIALALMLWLLLDYADGWIMAALT